MCKITKGEQTRNRIVKCAAELFLKNGYNSTGINDILQEIELPKGSFYFHFPSKKALAIEVSAYYETQLGIWVLSKSKEKKWEEFVTSLIGDIITSAKNKEYYGCPLLTLGQEIAFTDPDICKCYSDSLKKLIDIFAGIFENSGLNKKSSLLMANRSFALYEGYLSYFRISKDVTLLDMLLNDLIQIYKDYSRDYIIEGGEK